MGFEVLVGPLRPSNLKEIFDFAYLDGFQRLQTHPVRLAAPIVVEGLFEAMLARWSNFCSWPPLPRVRVRTAIFRRKSQVVADSGPNPGIFNFYFGPKHS